MDEKTIDQFFSDWETSALGYGYGSGEEHILKALKTFFALCPSGDADSRGYDYKVLEQELTPTVAWLLINLLCKWDILEYGTSPRYAWMTDQGYAMKKYFDERTLEQLCEACSHDENYSECYPDACNCDGPKMCANPFWDGRILKNRKGRATGWQ